MVVNSDRNFGVLIGTVFYYIAFYGFTPADDYAMYYYNLVTHTITADILSDKGVTGYTPDSDLNYAGMAYDGSDIIYFVLKKTSDSLHYLFSYSISGHTFTLGDESNTAIQLDRFCNPAGYTSDEIVEHALYEKAFAISAVNYDTGKYGLRVYRIPRVYTGKLWMIAQITETVATAVIVAITDNYVIIYDGTNYNVWELIDIYSTLIPHFEITHRQLTSADYYPSCKLTWLKKDGYQDPPIKDQFLQIYGRYTFSGHVTAFYGPNADDDIHNEPVGESGTNIAWVDSATLPNACTCTIIESLNSHKNVLKLTHDGGGSAPSIQHNFTSATSIIFEWYWASSDITRWQYIAFDSSTDHCVYIYISASKYYYMDLGVPTEIIGDTPVNNILDHFKLVADCSNDKFDLYINGVKRVDQGNFNIVGTSIIKVYIACYDNAAYSQYIDAPALVGSLDTTYQVYYASGQNKAKYLDDAVIFEGMVRERNLNIAREIYIESLAKEDLEFSPVISSYTNYTGQTTGVIITQLLTDFAKYITAGVISAGANTFVCPTDWSCDGDKTLLTIILELCDGELFLPRTRPTGELDVDVGTTSSNITYTNDIMYSDQQVKEFSQRINQVILYGGLVSGVPVGPATANDTAHQQQAGQIIIWSKTYGNVFDLTLLGTFATNKLTLQGSAPIIFWSKRLMKDFGFIQPCETLLIEASELRVEPESDEYVPADTYILYDNVYDGKNGISDLKLVDGLYFFEDPSETQTEQNSQLIAQISDFVVNTTPKINVTAGDPTVNDDITLGYKSGDIWINSADAGVWICISAADGAANWDELAKA